jgi:TonB family protein
MVGNRWLQSVVIASTLLVPARLSAQQGNAGSSGQAADEPKAPAPKRVRVSSGVSAALIVKKVQPEYPEEARRDHIQGTVTLHEIISKTGDVMELQLISGDPVLAEAAIQAVKQWKYKAYLLQGQPIEVDTQVNVNFTLSTK